MNLRRSKLFLLLSALVLPGLVNISCGRKEASELIIFTEVSSPLNDSSDILNIVSGIAALETGKEGKNPLNLSAGFYSASSPSVSSDGKLMVFAGKINKEDPWQIWQMDLGSMKSSKVTSLPSNCLYPAVLPTGRIVFCTEVAGDMNASGNAIFTIKPDGTDLKQVTFNPCSYSGVNVLSDGRLLVVTAAPGTAGSKLMVMRPDGTKNQLFYQGTTGSSVSGRVWETGTGKLVFTGMETTHEKGGMITEIAYNNPMQSPACLSEGLTGSFICVCPAGDGMLLAAYRKTDSKNFGLFHFDPSRKEIGTPIFQSAEFNITDVVVAKSHDRARKLPSEVDMGVKSGLLLCQDINFKDVSSSVKDILPGVSRVRIMGRDSSLGEVNVEKDGSVYLKIKSDTPFRLETLDDKGNVIGKPCTWLYLRPNERRGCVGCHESLDIVPENKVPEAVKHAPVVVPVHISSVKEKKVSLE
jgi:hypothetical protein